MTTIVTWTRDIDGNYEVSSINHLKQLMHMGTLYTDAGDFPTDYYGNRTKYLQTGDSTDIQPVFGGISNIGNVSYIKNILMTGVCKIQGVTQFAGMIIGRTSGIDIKHYVRSVSWILY